MVRCKFTDISPVIVLHCDTETCGKLLICLTFLCMIPKSGKRVLNKDQ